MQGFARRESFWTLEKSAFMVLLLAVLGIGGFVGYYYWERQGPPRASLLERETSQIEARVRENPQDPGARVNVAAAYLQKGQYDQAIVQFGQALALEEDNVAALLGLGTAYMQKGQKDKAIQQFTRVVEVIGDSEFAHVDRRLAAAHYYLGKTYLETGQLENASSALAKARGIDVSNADILYLSGLVSQRQGNQREAVDFFSKALRFDPAFTDAYTALAASYKTLGDGAKAAYAEAMAALFSGQIDSAIAKLEALVKAAPDADAYWGLGWAYERKGDKDRAVDAYKMALSINPRHMMASGSLQRLQASR